MKARGAGAAVAALVLAMLAVAGPLPAAAARAASTAAGAPLAATPITPNGSWPVYHRDDGHTGYDPTQPKAITATAGWTSAALDQSVFAEPLVYQGIVYAATLNNTVYALNQTDGSQVWMTHLRAPQTTGWTCGNVSPQGILGTPVIDPGSGRIYVATFGGDNVYRLEGLNLSTGASELSVDITANTSFDWHIQQERGALAVHGGYVYIPFGGRFGDCGSYHGWIFAVPIAGGAVLNYATPGLGAGFWSSGGVVIDDSTGKVFDTSGNGVASGCDANAPVPPNPNGTPVFENDAVVRLSATLAHEDAFVPEDWQANWCGNDQDLGSASMVLINPTLAFQAGKWGNGFLVNPQALGGMDGQLYPADPSRTSYTPVDVCRGNHIDANFGSYAYAAPFVYLGCDGHGVVALNVDVAAPSFSSCGSTCGAPSWNSGTFTSGPPIVAGGAVWTVDTGGGGLYGFDAATGAQIYHSAGFGSAHFTTPSEAGGQIFVGSDTLVRSFKMTPGCHSVSQSANPPSPHMLGGTIAITAVASGCPNASPDYEFWVLAPGASLYTDARPYSATNVFSWSTVGLAPGTYRINVWARDAQSPGAYSNPYGSWDTYDASLFYTLTPGCPGVSQSASPAGGAMISPSETVTVTASSPGCPNPTYEFWVLYPGAGLYTLAQQYSTSATLTWPTAGKAVGTYRFNVWVRDASSAGTSSNPYGTWDAYDAGLYYPLAAGCPGVSQSASPAGGAMIAATNATITAGAPGCPNPTYEFWVLYPGASLYTLAQQYSTSATLPFSTAGKPAGTYRFNVWVRDASSAGTYSNAYGSWDAYDASLYYQLTPGCPSVGVSTTPPSPSSTGTAITIAASAPGCPNPQFEYWILYPGASLYTLVQSYTPSTSISWPTTGLAPGTYRINIWVRDASSTGTYSNAYGSWDAYNAGVYYTLT